MAKYIFWDRKSPVILLLKGLSCAACDDSEDGDGEDDYTGPSASDDDLYIQSLGTNSILGCSGESGNEDVRDKLVGRVCVLLSEMGISVGSYARRQPKDVPKPIKIMLVDKTYNI